MEQKQSKTNVREMTLIALMAAVTCILGPLSVPIGVVPISLTNFAIYRKTISFGQNVHCKE